jgi:AcrR family transcriptional regulator
MARPADLREACVDEAFRVISERGVEGLSLREVARRLGVSHQAPYRHFPSRDHILAACVARTYAEFAAALGARRPGVDAEDDLRAMGEAYMGYSRREPLKYRLMFGTPLPPPDQHPEMMTGAQAAFGLLEGAVARAHADAGRAGRDARRDAMFVWSTIHGFASIRESEAARPLMPDPAALELMEAAIFERIGHVLAAGSPSGT